jgi:hypothetical protein
VNLSLLFTAGRWHGTITDEHMRRIFRPEARRPRYWVNGPQIPAWFDPHAWDYAWSLYSRADSSCKWEISGSSISKDGIRGLLKPDDVVVEEDPEFPAPSVSVPTKKQLNCAHNNGGPTRYQQTYGTSDSYRIEICDTCKSVTLARGKVPWHLLPRGYALLRMEP